MKLLLLLGLPLVTSAFFFPDQFLKEKQLDDRFIQELGGNAEARKARLEKIMNKETRKMEATLPMKLESRMSDVVPIPVKEPKDNKDLDIFQLNERLGVAPYLYHGDMSLSEEQLAQLERSLSGENRFKRQMSIFAKKWTDNTLNFFFEPYRPLNDRKKASVRAAHEYIQSRTCINFVEVSIDELKSRKISNVVAVYNGTGCRAAIGMQTGIQTLSLGDGCEYMGTAAHEFSHALGLLHMQARSDRNEYVDVNVDAIKPNYTSQFAEEPNGQDAIFTPYDYGSVMHYPADAFAKYENVLPMTSKDERYLYTMGTKQISFYDILNLNALYGCDSKCTTQNSAKCQNGGKPNPRNCAVCNCPRGYGGDFCDQRPAECGSTLKATAQWQTEQFTRGSIKDKKVLDVATECTHWITAPAGKQIEVKIRHSIHDKCQYGCRYNGIEIKTEADPRVSNPLICCDKFYNQVFTSSLNPAPVVSYDSENFNAFVFQYRYVDVSKPATVKPTIPTTTKPAPAPTGPCGESVFCPELVRKGFCQSSEPLARKKQFCGVSCGLCGDVKPTTTTTTAPASSEVCGEAVYCPELVKKGFCESSEPLHMKKKYCGMSCGLCGDVKPTTTTPAPVSSDVCGEAVYCPELVRKGFCESSEPLHMKKKYCGKSCGLCGNVKPKATTTTAPPSSEGCGEAVYCPELVKKGFCESSEPLHMKKKYCGVSCGLC